MWITRMSVVSRATAIATRPRCLSSGSSSSSSSGSGSSGSGSKSSCSTGAPLQQLLDSLLLISDIEAAAAHPACCPHLMKCLSIMNRVTLSEVGLDAYPLTRIEDSLCMSIYESDKFDISLFIVPAGLAMPYHDHPNMTVLSKLLSGSALCTSFTPLLPTESAVMESSESELRALTEKPFFMREVASKTPESDAWYLTPSRGNIHAIHALPASTSNNIQAGGVEPVIMLDILLPPYNSLTRPCRYYTPSSHPIWIPTTPVGLSSVVGDVVDDEKKSDVGTAQEEWKWKKWVLEEIDEPTDMLPYSAKYPGVVPVP